MRDEETGIEALGRPGWREPVAEVGPVAQVDAKLQLVAQRRDGTLAALHGLAPVGVGPRHLVLMKLSGKQQPHLFEALARGSHQVVQAALGQTQGTARGLIVPTQAMAVRLTVARIQHPPWEDGRTTAQIAIALGPAQHQHFHTAHGQVAQDDDGSRLAGVGKGVVGHSFRQQGIRHLGGRHQWFRHGSRQSVGPGAPVGPSEAEGQAGAWNAPAPLVTVDKVHRITPAERRLSMSASAKPHSASTSAV